MNFLFIATVLGPNVGGTEVLIARMSKWLIKRRYSVTLLTSDVSGFRDLFPPQLKLIELGNSLLDLCFLGASRKMLSDLRLPAPDLIKTFDLRASWISCVLAAHQAPPQRPADMAAGPLRGRLRRARARPAQRRRGPARRDRLRA